MASIFRYSGDVWQGIIGTVGSAGDMCYVSTGSLLTYRCNASGTAATNAFVGVLEDSATAGETVAVRTKGVFSLPKHATANKIELGDIIYGTASANTVGTAAVGTALGVCAKQSATTDANVDVFIINKFVSGAGGFHA